MKEKVTELVRCRYKCRVCSDIIESNGYLVSCCCGAIAVDARPGDPYLPRRMQGKQENFLSLCEWRTVSGELICEGFSEDDAGNQPDLT